MWVTKKKYFQCKVQSLQCTTTSLSLEVSPHFSTFSCRVDSTEAGDYQLCFENEFSKISEKMVFFKVIVITDRGQYAWDEWPEEAIPENLLDYKLQDIRVRSGNSPSHLEQLPTPGETPGPYSDAAFGFIFVSLCRRAWTRCTGNWSRAVRSSLHCGLLRRGTATSWKTTFGECPSGPASTCSSFLPLPSLKSSPCEISSMVPGVCGHSHRKKDILAAAQLNRFEKFIAYILWEPKDLKLLFKNSTPWKQHVQMMFFFPLGTFQY